MKRRLHRTTAPAQKRKMTRLRRSAGSAPNTARLWHTRRCSAPPEKHHVNPSGLPQLCASLAHATRRC
ncbi:hypothetical protein NDU88_002203 [Pleurodeles waltl]|uniref:Uncharacterized protein n=1 Tax=Pleurodeles waltl TaxID=8319 RepID=A0AAV7M0V2_PLEWA|nr:hypothetical protein NDU88_002203 [Pleurodeles waltl]